VLATGDRREVAEAVAAGLAFDALRAELTPDQKVMVVLSERNAGPVMMIGDDVNDAPALVAADVGIAMGANGAAASAVRRRCRSSPGPRG
jgi:P-type E1-E2 ATPase